MLTSEKTSDAVPTKDAFEEALQATISRLRDDANLALAAGRNQGRVDGEEWARSDASLADLRRVCEAEEVADHDDLLELLSEDWDSEYLDKLGADYDRPSFMRGYPDGFWQGAMVIWQQVRNSFGTNC